MFIERFRAVVKSRGDAPAIEYGELELTYTQLWNRACALDIDCGPGDIVMYDASDRLQHLLMLLHIWSKGAAIAPIDGHWPRARIQQLVDTTDPSVLILDSPRRLRGACDDGVNYVFHTSGSSGQPKSVALDGTALPMVVDQQRAAFEVDSDSRVLWMLSSVFDASLSDIAVALLSGATLVVCDPLSPSNLLTFIKACGVSHADIPPAFLRHWANLPMPETLHTVVVGGETPPDLGQLPEQINIFNVYGPTEATICTSMKRMRSETPASNIGRPLEGVEYRIEDDELWIGGPHLALGYRNNPELTAERFQDGWYRTGDRVTQDANGDFHFHGRIDRQFKINGRLICPEEVESRVSSLTGRRCFVFKDGPILGCVYEDDEDQDLKSRLAADLPTWMIPTTWRRVEKLPTTPSGKVKTSELRGVTSSYEEKTPFLDVVAELLQPLDPRRSFAENGGDSIMAMEVSAIAADRGIFIPPEALLQDAALNQISPDDRIRVARLRSVSNSLAMPGSFVGPTDLGRTLVLGANGFLGRHVCEQLESPLRLVRRNTGVPDEVVGDVTQTRLGLSDTDWDRIQDVTHIVNCAGVISLSETLEFHRPVNLDALTHIADVQHHLHAHLTHVSTLSVFVHSNNRRPHYSPETPISDDTLIIGGYAQSKVAAELALQRHGGPLTIVRPGLLTPATHSPSFPQNDLLRDFIIGLTHLGVAPNIPDLAFDVTPVDWAAARIIESAHENGTHHISMGCIFLIGLCNSLNLQSIDVSEWQSIHPSTREGRIAKLALARHTSDADQLHAVDLFQRTGTQFGPLTPLPDDLLDTYIQAALESQCAA